MIVVYNNTLSYTILAKKLNMVALQSKILARLVFSFSLLFVGNSGRTTVVAMMKDTATGIPFDDKSKGGLNIFGVGCRKKGPIKVYSCGMYCTEKVQEDLSTISLSGSKKKALSTLRKRCSENPTAFVLKMASFLITFFPVFDSRFQIPNPPF